MRQRLTNSLNLNTNTIIDGIGNGDRATILGRIDLGTVDFSISFWAYKFKDWNEQSIISQWVDTNNRFYIRANSANPPNFQLYHRISGTAVLNGDDNTDLDNALYIENWMHVVCTVDRSDELRWYVNGALSGDAGTVDGSGDEASGKEGTSLSAALGDIAIGHFIHTSFDDHHFNGQIDDVLIYSDKLESTEVTRIYNAGKRSHR